MIIEADFDSSTSAAPPGFFTAVNAAVAFWERELINPITVTIQFSFGTTGPNVLGSSATDLFSYSYADLRNALAAAATSADDHTSVANLPNSFPAANAQFLIASDEALALGLPISATQLPDVTLSSAFPFTYDPLHRAVPGDFDAVGVLEHEISEVLGRLAFSGGEFTPPAYSVLDFFRYTAPHQLQLSPGAAYFSIDGGVTQLLPFNDPASGADAGDWAGVVTGDSFGDGSPGVASLVSPTDLRVMDVLGYTLASTASSRPPHDDFLNAGKSDFLIENSSGAIQVGQVGSNGQVAYSPLATLATTWLFAGSGDYIGQGHDQFLIENSSSNGIDLVQVGSGDQVTTNRIANPAPGWTVVGSGDYLGQGHDQFLLENGATGAVDIGQVPASKIATLTPFASLGTWRVVGSGDLLGLGRDQFLIENPSGQVYIAQTSGAHVTYHSFARLGTAWTVVGDGDYRGEGHDQVLIEKTSGALYTADVGPGQEATYHSFSQLASGWKVVGSGDYLGEGHDQFLIESASGVVEIGDFTGGAVHFAQVSTLAAQWTIHG
jgi:hypothetical protein